jgi:trehalose 6-phosphate phosphatase
MRTPELGPASSLPRATSDWALFLDVDGTRWEEELPGVMIEDKGSTVAVHYRLAPASESELERRVRDAMGDLEPELELVAGKKVFEIRPRGAGKDVVVEAFMAELPFRDRVPVFLGDDRTDEDGFRAVNALHGHSIRVGDAGPSAARHRLPSTAAVHDWLAAVAGDLEAARGVGADRLESSGR